MGGMRGLWDMSVVLPGWEAKVRGIGMTQRRTWDGPPEPSGSQAPDPTPAGPGRAVWSV